MGRGPRSGLVHISEDRPIYPPTPIGLRNTDFIHWNRKSSPETAKDVLAALVQTTHDKSHLENRFSIFENVVRRRPRLGKPAREWLRQYVEERHDPFEQFLFRHTDDPEGSVDDEPFRHWLRTQLIAACDRSIDEKKGTITLDSKQYHRMMTLVSWTVPDPELVQKLIEVVDTSYVPYVNKSDPIACLAQAAKEH